MNKLVYNIRIINENFGNLLEETFVDKTQFKLFLKMVHVSIEMNEDLTFFNGEDFFVHIPNKILKESIIVTKTNELNIIDQIRSKIEALTTK